MSIADKVKKGMVEGSAIRKMFEEGIALKKKYGNDKVFDLSLGNPIMEPPEEFNGILRKLVESPTPGMHRYMENAGYPETRAAVAAQLTADTGIKFKWDEVVMTCGTAGALNIVLMTILNPGDEVIVFAPYFFEYVNYTENFNGVIKVIPCDEQLVPKFDLLEAAVTPKTKAVVINSPGNPTGVVYSDSVLRQIGQVLLKKGAQYGTVIYALCDDVYCKLVYDGMKCPRMVHHYPHSIVTSSFSKELGLPGERIGYAALHPECGDRKDLISGLIYSIRVLGFVNAPALMQHVVSRLKGASVDIAEYQKKRDLLYNNLVEMGYSVVKPQGAFYVFPKCPTPDDVAFVEEMKRQLVLTVPGYAFGTPGYIRLCYCLDDRTLEGSLPGLRKAIEKYKR